MKALIADESEDMLNALEILLKDHGFEVAFAYNCDDLLDKLQKKEYDLIISDIRLPKMGGLNLGIEIRKKYPLLPIIFLLGIDKTEKDYLAEIARLGSAYGLNKLNVSSLGILLNSNLKRT